MKSCAEAYKVKEFGKQLLKTWLSKGQVPYYVNKLTSTSSAYVTRNVGCANVCDTSETEHRIGRGCPQINLLILVYKHVKDGMY